MALTFRIQLRGIKKQPVWRRIVIPSNFTFHHFHQAIQDAFGWENMHLYQFEKSPFCHGWRIAVPNEYDMDFEFRSSDSRNTLVLDYIQMMGLKKFVYVYDFGDSWVHDITLEEISENDMFAYPVCLAGKGLCPPEDCGGVWGYEDMKQLLLEALNSEEAQQYRGWLCLSDEEDFDPQYFDIDEVNDMLRSIEVCNDEHTREDERKIESPRPISLLDAMKKLSKADIIDFAEDLNLTVDESAGEKEIKRQYAQALLDNPRKVLDQLPLYELQIIERLKEGEDGPDIVDVYDDYLLLWFG